MSGGDSGEVGRHPAYVWTMIPLCVLAVILNTMVIIAVTKYGRFKSSVDIFLVSLAVSEILQSSVVFPIHLLKSSSSDQDFFGGNAVCKLTMFLPLSIVMAAILSMVVMAIDRYRCIINHKVIGRRTAVTLVGCIWLCSFIVSGPQLYEYNIYSKFLEKMNATIESCGSENIAENFETIYASLVFSIAYFMPLLILIICYTCILLHVWKHSGKFIWKRQNRVNPITVNARIEETVSARKLRVLKLLISITSTFTILWTPYFILFALTEIMHMDDSSQFVQWPHVLGRILSASSNLVNPVIFIMFSDKLRARLYGVIRCQVVCGREKNTALQSVFIAPGRSDNNQATTETQFA